MQEGDAVPVSTSPASGGTGSGSTAPAAGDPVLEAVGVDKRFAGVHALRAVDFTLVAGEVHAVVGENGAGKSTLIKVLTGVYTPDAGIVRYRGEPVRWTRPAEAQAAGVSTIYQEVNLVPLMSVAQNVFLGREPRRFGVIDVRTMHRRAAELLAEYGIDVDVRRPLRSLGLGVQQMVAIARAVSTEARVVVMDEPTSSLEHREVETLFGVIRMLQQRGIAVVYVSHRLDELYRVCQSVTVLRDGVLVHRGDLMTLDRVELVAMMLGRTVEQVRREGRTEFSGDHHIATEPILTARGLRRRHVLNDVSLDVRPGEVVGLGGLLGAGRTETVKTIAGAMRVDAGEVRVDGRRVRPGSTAAAVRAGIVLLPEDRKAEGIIGNLSVRENIVLAALPRLSPAGLVSERRQRAVVSTFMQRLRIKASSPEQKVSELSGGNQQKVLLARWLAMSPRVLMLDEPTRGIDVGAKAEVRSLVEDLANEGLGVVLVSSELEEIVEGADRVVVLKEGSVVTELRGEQVTEDRILAALAEPVPALEDVDG